MQRLILTLLMLFALTANAEIRLYEVARGQERQVAEALAAVLSAPNQEGVPSGVIELLPSGQILVNTSPDLHADIETLIQVLNNKPPPLERNYQIHFWVLFVPDSPAAEFSRQAPADEPELVNALAREYGDRPVQLLMQASASSVANRNASMRLLQGNIAFRLISGPSGLQIETNVSVNERIDGQQQESWALGSHTAWHSVQALLQPDEYLVLADTNQTLEQQPGQLLLVIQWDESGQ